MEKKSTPDSPSTEPGGEAVDLPHDRMTVERFRQAFPRSRWSDTLNAWFVPGRTAQKRTGRWLAEREAEADAFADDKGRDAFAFDPIESRYLEAAPAGFHLRTSFSMTLVSLIREIPQARWDADRRLWTAPYRSFTDLRRLWPEIETIAAHSEPEARKARRDSMKGTDEELAAKSRTNERRKKRYPIPIEDSPPFTRAIGTHIGVVFLTETAGEIADGATVNAFYFAVDKLDAYAWPLGGSVHWKSWCSPSPHRRLRTRR